MPIAIGSDHLDIAIPSQWRDQEWQHLIDQLPDQLRTIRLHPAIEADLQRALATETDQPKTEPNPPATEQSSNPAPAETASTLDLNAESFLHDFNRDGVLESDEDDDTQLARSAIDLETSLKDAEASPVVTLVDRILLQAIGEKTGEMDKMLSKVADFYEDEVGAMVKALTSMLEPAMIVVVGGIVGSILLAMYLPMFTVFDQIQ